MLASKRLLTDDEAPSAQQHVRFFSFYDLFENNLKGLSYAEEYRRIRGAGVRPTVGVVNAFDAVGQVHAIDGQLQFFLDIGHKEFGVFCRCGPACVGTAAQCKKHPIAMALCPGWRQAVRTLVSKWSPMLHRPPKPPIVTGIDLGDELLHVGLSVANLTLAADTIRAELTRIGALDTILYANFGCCQVTSFPQPTGIGTPGFHIPASMNITGTSIDLYNRDSSDIAPTMALYKSDLFPKLLPHQSVWLLPGTFGDLKNRHANDTQVAARLAKYWHWAQTDTRISGISPFVYFNGTYGDLGAEGLPQSLAVLKRIGTCVAKQLPAPCAV